MHNLGGKGGLQTTTATQTSQNQRFSDQYEIFNLEFYLGGGKVSMGSLFGGKRKREF